MTEKIDFEKEYYAIPTNDGCGEVGTQDVLNWAKSIAERVESETIQRCAEIADNSDTPYLTINSMKRIYAQRASGEKGESK